MKHTVILVTTLLIALPVFAKKKTICEADDRLPSTDPKIARVLQPTDVAGCTITMIGRSCAISAGHCKVTFGIAEFNTPPSVNGAIVHPAKEDIYPVDMSSLVSVDNGIGDDYAVVRINANKITGKLPGDAQGFYPVSFDAPKVGSIVRITGYGMDSPDPTRNFAQQTNTGPIVKYDSGTAGMYHKVDTMGGNSGSTIILEETNEIIGIHTHGGCGAQWGTSANGSTAIAKHDKIKKAVKACLQWEKDNL